MSVLFVGYFDSTEMAIFDSTEMRRRPMGTQVAKTLRWFSLDLVSLVLSYIYYGTASSNGRLPQLLHNFGVVGVGAKNLSGACVFLACAPDGNVWVIDQSRVCIFSANGRFLRAAARSVLCAPVAISFDPRLKQAFVADVELRNIVICSLNGRFLRYFFAKPPVIGQQGNIAVDIQILSGTIK